jgi:hypothetical protein
VVGELRVPEVEEQVELFIILLMFYSPVSNTILSSVPVALAMMFLLPGSIGPGQHK